MSILLSEHLFLYFLSPVPISLGIGILLETRNMHMQISVGKVHFGYRFLDILLETVMIAKRGHILSSIYNNSFAIEANFFHELMNGVIDKYQHISPSGEMLMFLPEETMGIDELMD